MRAICGSSKSRFFFSFRIPESFTDSIKLVLRSSIIEGPVFCALQAGGGSISFQAVPASVTVTVFISNALWVWLQLEVSTRVLFRFLFLSNVCSLCPPTVTSLTDLRMLLLQLEVGRLYHVRCLFYQSVFIVSYFRSLLSTLRHALQSMIWVN